MRVGRAHHVEHPDQVDVDHRPEAVRRHPVAAATKLPAAPETSTSMRPNWLAALSNAPADRVEPADVRGDAEKVAAGCPQRG